MASSLDAAEEVRKPGRDCADLEPKLRKGKVFQCGVRLPTVHRPRLSMYGQAYANATRKTQAIFRRAARAGYAEAGSAVGIWMASSIVSTTSHATFAIFLIK
jgi:hypothetical protein